MLVLWDDENQSYSRYNDDVKLIVTVLYDWFESLWENMFWYFYCKVSRDDGESNKGETSIGAWCQDSKETKQETIISRLEGESNKCETSIDAWCCLMATWCLRGEVTY